jgi:hypothetical protein
VPNVRIKDEINYLYIRKQHLNQQIYHLHLNLANTWNNTCPYIQHTIEEKLQKGTQDKYVNLDNKLNKLIREQTVTPRERHTFHPRVINNTNTTFSNSETTLLERGLKYNLHTKKKNCLLKLALETERAITQLPNRDREFYRKLVADRIETLQHHNNSNLIQNTHPDSRTIKSIQTRLKNYNAMTTVNDKDNSIVILPIQQYETKIQNFLPENNFQNSTIDPTKTFQTHIIKTINYTKTLMSKESKWKYVNLNPSGPNIRKRSYKNTQT